MQHSRYQRNTSSPETIIPCGRPHWCQYSRRDGTLLLSGEKVLPWCCEIRIKNAFYATLPSTAFIEVFPTGEAYVVLLTAVTHFLVKLVLFVEESKLIFRQSINQVKYLVIHWEHSCARLHSFSLLVQLNILLLPEADW